MTEEFIAKEIKDIILVENFKRYFETLEYSSQEPFKNKSWRSGQLLFNSLDNSNRKHLQEFVKMIMIETVSDILSFVDGTATFKNQQLFLMFNDGIHYLLSPSINILVNYRLLFYHYTLIRKDAVDS